MSAVYVIGVDPGVSTGVVVLRANVLYDAYQCHWSAALPRLREFLNQRQAEADASIAIACERFQATGQRGARTHQPTAQQVIGRVEELADEFACTFVLQAPADAKRLAPNALLREVGLYHRGRDVQQPDANDVNDAARHAVLYLARRHAVLFDHLLGMRPH